MFGERSDKAQGSMLIYLLIFLILILFVFPLIQGPVLVLGWTVLYPLIGFEGRLPVLTILLAGIIVVTISSIFTHIFTDWRKIAEAQEIAKAFQAELTKARKEGNTNRINKLMKMYPEVTRKQTEVSSNSMKSTIFLIIFIWPIFLWLRSFLAYIPNCYFTLPWANNVPLVSNEKIIMQAWLWMYLVFSTVLATIIRQLLKYISFSDWWRNRKAKVKPTQE